MPSLEIDSRGVESVSTLGSFLEQLLARGETVKTTASIEPALDKSDFEDLSQRLKELCPDVEPTQRWAPVETVARDLFSNLVVGASRGQPCYPLERSLI